MRSNTSAKPDFLDEVSDEMDKGGDDAYGAEMEDEDDEGSPEDEKEDRILAVKQFARAAGITLSDPAKAADALTTLIKSCL